MGKYVDDYKCHSAGESKDLGERVSRLEIKPH
jgi:hypothetical protein